MAEVEPGASDLDVIGRARREDRLILTEDKDFGELVFRRMQPVPGLVLLRIDADSETRKWPRLQAALVRFERSLFGRYTVVEVARFRSRSLQLKR